nr:MAG TPA: hypothetical protein [Bacteriophage sp.]
MAGRIKLDLFLPGQAPDSRYSPTAGKIVFCSYPNSVRKDL